MPKSKKWYLREISDLGVIVLRDGQELKDRRGEALGPIKNIRRPYTRKTCEQAGNFWNTALQVGLTLKILFTQINNV